MLHPLTMAPCLQDKLELDHAIVLVGYDVTPKGEPYYILKNSWSEEWGEKGYMRIARNVGPEPFVSQCGLASMPTMVFRCVRAGLCAFLVMGAATGSVSDQSFDHWTIGRERDTGCLLQGAHAASVQGSQATRP